MSEQPRGHVLVAVGVEVAAAAVLRAVENTGRILKQPGTQFALKLQTNIAVRNQLRRQSTLDEEQVLPALQSLQSHGLFELAGLHLEFRQDAVIDVGIEH